MKVILIKNIKSLGMIGDEVSTSRGYAINYLLENKLAIYATEANKKFIQKQKELLEKNSDSEKTRLEKLCDKIQNKTIKLILQASKDGKLFGSVNSKKIAEEISKIAEEKISYQNIKLKESLKMTGVYNIEVAFSDEVSTTVQLAIGESEISLAKILNTDKKDSSTK